MNVDILQQTFDMGMTYDQFVASGDPMHQPQWHQRYEQLALDDAQHALVSGFRRPMKILCLTGTWCGDCSLQGASLHRIAEAAGDLVELRFVPRDEQFAELVVANRINDGYRVPVTWFMAEDFHPCSRIGDRTLSRYRSMARKALGDASPVLAEPPADPVRTVLQEMLDEFERVELLLRMSPRLRELHGD